MTLGLRRRTVVHFSGSSVLSLRVDARRWGVGDGRRGAGEGQPSLRPESPSQADDRR